MVEFAQSLGNLSEASSNLHDLLKGRNIVLCEDAAKRLAFSCGVAVETARGLRIAKQKASHKIDSVVALAQAALGAVQQSRTGSRMTVRELFTGDILRDHDLSRIGEPLEGLQPQPLAAAGTREEPSHIERTLERPLVLPLERF